MTQLISEKDKDKTLCLVETFSIDDNRKLKAAVPDENGYFIGVPMAVLGTVTRNNTKYDSNSMLNGIKSEDSSFRMRLNEGTLFGEWGHPIADFSTNFGMYRLLNLDPQKESHNFRNVYIKRLEDMGIDLVCADVKPTGPYGKYFEERMIDPTMNCAFSLRSISRETIDPRTRIANRTVIKLVTFDAGVASGGYKEASKRYMVSTECFGCASIENINHIIEQKDIIELREVSLETFSNTELNEFLKSTRVTINHTTTTYVDKKNGLLLDMSSRKEKGMFHSLIKAK